MNEKAHTPALQCRRRDVETTAIEKGISAQNCADVLTRALAPNVFRRLLNDRMLVDFATARPARILQCHAAVWSVGGGANNGEDDNHNGDRYGAGRR